MAAKLKQKSSFFYLPFYFLFTIFFNIQNSPQYNPPGYDREVFRYLGRVLLEGGMPYRDGFDIKPPIVFYVSALGEALGGAFGNWIVFSFITAFAAWYFFKRTRTINFWGAAFTSVSFVMLSTWPGFSEGGGLTRLISSALVLILLSFTEGSRFKSRDYILGILMGLIFWTQQNEILATAPFVIFFLYESKKPLDTFIKALVGALATTFVILSPFILTDTLNDLWKQTFLYTMKFHVQWEKQTYTQVVRGYLSHLADHHLLRCTCYALASTAFIFIINKKQRPLALAAIVAVVLQGWATSLSARYFPHYFLSLIPYVSFLLSFPTAPSLKSHRGSFLKTAFGIFIFVAFMKKAPVATMQAKWKEYKNPPEKSLYLAGLPNVGSYLKQVEGQKGQFIVLNNAEALALHTDYKILAPNKWMVQDFLETSPAFNITYGEFSAVVLGMEKYKTRYVLDYTLSRPFRLQKNKQYLESYLQKHYKLILADADKKWRFLERK